MPTSTCTILRLAFALVRLPYYKVFLRNTLPILQDIVDAACLLYDLNITHRDIKAQNILLQNGRTKLADFGFAKEMREKDVR